jgi:hypothetical protein
MQYRAWCGRVLWVIPVMWEVEVEGSWSGTSPRQKAWDHIWETKAKKSRRGCLPSKHKALSSNTCISRGKKCDIRDRAHLPIQIDIYIVYDHCFLFEKAGKLILNAEWEEVKSALDLVSSISHYRFLIRRKNS